MQRSSLAGAIFKCGRRANCKYKWVYVMGDYSVRCSTGRSSVSVLPHAKGYRRNNNQLAAGGRGEMAIGMETTTQRGHILPITNNYCPFRVRADVVFGLWAVNFILAARCLNVKLHQIIRVIDVTAD